MRQTINAEDCRAMLGYVARRIGEAEARLNALDSAAGDGDHGITMRLGFQAIQHTLANSTLSVPTGEVTIGEVMKEAGNAFMEATGGAIGVILGKMFIAAGKSLGNLDAMGPLQWKAVLVSMEESAVKTGKAAPGDKTIVDALHAAAGAVDRVSADDDLSVVLNDAAQAAEAAAARTAEMPCRMGRASRLGDRSIGHADPGAVSFSIILRAMAEWIHRPEFHAQNPTFAKEA